MLKNFTNSVTGWLGVVKHDDDDPAPETNQSTGTDKHDKEVSPTTDSGTSVSAEKPTPTAPDTNEAQEQKEGEGAEDMQHQIDEMSAKAVTTAKEWGSECTK